MHVTPQFDEPYCSTAPECEFQILYGRQLVRLRAQTPQEGGVRSAYRTSAAVLKVRLRRSHASTPGSIGKAWRSGTRVKVL